MSLLVYPIKEALDCLTKEIKKQLTPLSYTKYIYNKDERFNLSTLVRNCPDFFDTDKLNASIIIYVSSGNLPFAETNI